MPNYAFGIAGRDEQIAREDAHNRTRQQNISDLLNGMGVLAQAMGAAHRFRQQQADEGVASQFAGQMLTNPAGDPSRMVEGPPPPESGMGPGRPVPQPWGEAIGRKLSAADNLENVGTWWNPSGHLRLPAAAQLMGMQGTQLAQRQQGLREQRNAVMDAARMKLMGQQGDAAEARAYRDRNPSVTGTSETSEMMNAKRLADAMAESDLLEGYAMDAATVERGTKEVPWYGDQAAADQNKEVQAAKARLEAAGYKDTRATRSAAELRSLYAQKQDLIRSYQGIREKRGRGAFDIHREGEGAGDPDPGRPSPAPAQGTADTTEHPLVQFGKAYAAKQGWNWATLTDEQLAEIREMSKTWMR